MELRVFTRDLEPLGIVDELISTIWQPTYWQQGNYDDCKLLAPVTKNNNTLLVKGNIVVLHGEAAEFTDEQGEWRRAMQITYRHITKDENNTEQIELQGCFLKKWFSKRVLLSNQIITGTNQEIINQLITNNVGDEAISARQFENFIMLAQDDLGGESVDYTTKYGDGLADAIYERALSGKLGYDILVNERNQLYGFWLYKGTDMSSGNSAGNTPCIFSRDFDNVTEQDYTESIENMKNVCYCTSAADEDGTIYAQEVENETETGIDRDEFYVDMTNISWTVKDEQGEETRLTPEQYLELMSTEAYAQLDDYGELMTFESTINTSKNLQYKEDFNVGDVVTTIEKNWGIRIDARITKISETWQSGKHTLEVTFGESMPTLLDKIKKVR
ncbi:hypothetical protein D6855_16370 [Butyrivibrio sp. CB08]|uniref:siphovirus ReqiPepy6 Gp37-like family protein n=1 Tax=Butyrivibrio sp. CB08 TaxID=2364879 RepID=UPI000EAAB8FD|nr:siphovirus ReqiPepy6 Gp37-like family protein [Butyrivibrio sp. CB08]RKM55091.1 hypothetical protein D6855_16370 [Butyrivibrio sp. CB08]